MTRYRLVHVPSNRTAAVIFRADSWWQKGWGVLGQRALPAGEGLWLPGVASVHTLFVGFALDLLFLDNALRTIKFAEGVPPGRLVVGAVGAAHTLELSAGTLASCGITPGAGEGWRLERE